MASVKEHSVMVHSTSISSTYGMFPVFSNTAMAGTDVCSRLPIFHEPTRHCLLSSVCRSSPSSCHCHYRTITQPNQIENLDSYRQNGKHMESGKCKHLWVNRDNSILHLLG